MMRSRSARGRSGSAVLAGVAALLLVSAGGCYQRIVRAEGLGARGVDVYEPSVRDDSNRDDLKPKPLKVAPLDTRRKRR